ncbi:MAG: hypothetical protein CL525_16160 [Aequorivita sp.]|nr:hypothetical protein [Aequorivita sp.]
MKRKEFLIDYKGTLRSNHDSDVEINAIKYTNHGQIRLNGTDRNLETFLRDLQLHSDFELIKVHELNEVIGIVNLHEAKEEGDSVLSIQEERFFDQEGQPKGKANISQIVNLIKEHGSEDKDVIRFLSTQGEFRFNLDRDGLRSYIQKNLLK